MSDVRQLTPAACIGNSPVSVGYRLVSNKGSTLLSQIKCFPLYLCIYRTFANFAPMQYGDSTLAP